MCDTLPPLDILQQFKGLKGLAIGLEKRGKIKDASKIVGVAKRVDWLTLIGRWINCTEITNLENIRILSLSHFSCDSFEFLHGMKIETLNIHSCKGFDKKIAKHLPSLFKLQIY